MMPMQCISKGANYNKAQNNQTPPFHTIG